MSLKRQLAKAIDRDVGSESLASIASRVVGTLRTRTERLEAMERERDELLEEVIAMRDKVIAYDLDREGIEERRKLDAELVECRAALRDAVARESHLRARVVGAEVAYEAQLSEIGRAIGSEILNAHGGVHYEAVSAIKAERDELAQIVRVNAEQIRGLQDQVISAETRVAELEQALATATRLSTPDYATARSDAEGDM